MVIDLDKCLEVIRKYESGHEYESLEVCIRDIIPETRSNQTLLDDYRNWISDKGFDELELEPTT